MVRSLPAASPLLGRIEDEPPVFLVGGAVRDLLLGGRPADLDLVVVGDARTLARRLGGEIRDHDRFGTAVVTLDGRRYDIAQARRERYPFPGSLPEVAPAPLSEDLLRRDFTVNAIAIGLNGPTAGDLSAAPHALADLDERRLRVLHDRSFEDDPTRLFRLARYAGRLGFMVEDGTRALAQKAIEAGAPSTVSGNRIGAELRLLAREDDPVAALVSLRDLGLDAAIHPRFGLDDPEELRRALELLPGDGRRDLLTLAAAAQQVPEGELSALLDHLAFEATERETVLRAAAHVRDAAEAVDEAGAPSQIARALARIGPEGAALVGAKGRERRVRDWLERLRHVRLLIDGDDLLAAGVSEGPAVGRALRAALDAKLDGRANGREAELAEALRAAG